MKVGIIGCGVIGTLYGWALSKTNEVEHIVRKERFDELLGKTYRMDIVDERMPEGDQDVFEYYYPDVVEYGKEYDLIIVPVPEDSLESVLSMLKDNHSPLFVMASNWNGTEQIEKYVPMERYVLGYAGGGGTFRDENGAMTLWGNIGEDLAAGSVDRCQDMLLRTISVAFWDIGITCEDHGNILHWLWMHNVDSAIIGAGLSKYDDMERFILDEDMIRLCFAATSEAFSICAEKGVDISTFHEVSMYAMPFEELYPMFRDNMLQNPVMKRYTAHALKAVPEMVANFKKICSTGKELGIETPNLDRLRRSSAKSLFSLPHCKYILHEGIS